MCAIAGFAGDLTKRIPDTKLEGRAVDGPDLDLGEQATRLSNAQHKVKARAHICMPIKNSAKAEDIGSGAATQINIPRIFPQRYPIRELRVQCYQCEIIAASHFKIRPEPQFVNHWSEGSMTAEIELCRICANTSANAHTFLSLSVLRGDNDH